MNHHRLNSQRLNQNKGQVHVMSRKTLMFCHQQQQLMSTIILLLHERKLDAGIAFFHFYQMLQALFTMIQQRDHIGDWVSIIVKFPDNREFRLRPILMTFEDRNNIAWFIQETCIRMAAAASIHLRKEVTLRSFGRIQHFEY